MIYIKTKQTSFDYKYQWKVGDDNLLISPKFVYWIKVDGEELENIKATIKNIPISNKQYEIWFGETAQYILTVIGAIVEVT